MKHTITLSPEDLVAILSDWAVDQHNMRSPKIRFSADSGEGGAPLAVFAVIEEEKEPSK